jgi:fucose permease
MRSWLFILSCIALITSAFTFSIRGEVLQDMGRHFDFKQEDNGSIDGARFWGMAASLLIGGFICDVIGMKRVMWLAFLSHVGGTLGMLYAPVGNSSQSLNWLCAFSFIMGCGNGFTETAINPLVATLFPREKTHYLNILHAWWPGGLIIGGLLALYVGKGIDLDLGFMYGPHLVTTGLQFSWWQTLGLILVPAAVYGLMLLPSRFPPTERVASGVSSVEMLGQAFRPLFIIWGFCMVLTASTELGPQNWQASVMEKTADLKGTQILVYTSGMMFILRHFAGPIAHRISPIGLLLVSSILSGVGLYLLSFANNAATAFGYATIFGLGIAYFWPTMLGVVSERFPKGGAMLLCLLGTIGNAAIAFTIPQMGRIVDIYSVETVQSSKTDADLAKTILKVDEAGKATSLNIDAIDAAKRRLAAIDKPQPEPPAPADPPKPSPVDDLAPEQLREIASLADQAQSRGFSMAFRWVSALPGILVLIFGAIWLYDRSQGGYKAVHLLTEKQEDELIARGH